MLPTRQSPNRCRGGADVACQIDASRIRSKFRHGQAVCTARQAAVHGWPLLCVTGQARTHAPAPAPFLLPTATNLHIPFPSFTANITLPDAQAPVGTSFYPHTALHIGNSCPTIAHLRPAWRLPPGHVRVHHRAGTIRSDVAISSARLSFPHT